MTAWLVIVFFALKLEKLYVSLLMSLYFGALAALAAIA